MSQYEVCHEPGKPGLAIRKVRADGDIYELGDVVARIRSASGQADEGAIAIKAIRRIVFAGEKEAGGPE